MTLFSAVFFLMMRRPPRSTLDRSSAASDVYKRQAQTKLIKKLGGGVRLALAQYRELAAFAQFASDLDEATRKPVSYTHLRAHETVLDIVCRLLLEKKKTTQLYRTYCKHYHTRDNT